MKSAYEIGCAALATEKSRRHAQHRNKRRSCVPRDIPARAHAERYRCDLSPAMKRALRSLATEGAAIPETKCWRTSRGTAIPLETLLALFDRYLVQIVIESRDRRRTRKSATLTEIGRLVAEGLIMGRAARERDATVSEAAMPLSASVADNFEASDNVYSPEPETEEIA